MPKSVPRFVLDKVRLGIDESVFKYVLKYMYVLIPLPNLNPNLIYFELYFEVRAHTYTPTAGATGLPYKERRSMFKLHKTVSLN